MAPLLRLGAAAFALAASISLANCSTGPANTTPLGSTSPGATTTTVPTAGGTVVLPPAANGQTVSFGIGAGAPSGTSITASVSTVAPDNAPVPSALRRTTKAIVGAQPFLYVAFSVTQTVSASIFTSEAVALLATFPSPAAYYIEFDDVTSLPGTKLGCAGPATVASLTAMFDNHSGFGACTSGISLGEASLFAGHTYLAQFYYVPGAVPTATPSPAPTLQTPPPSTPPPTPAPTPGGLVVTSSSLFFAGSSPAPQTFTASQTAFSGTFTTIDTCAGFATVSGSSPTFTVTATAAPATASTAPTCTVTVSNGIGDTATVNVYISTVGVTVNSRGRRQ